MSCFATISGRYAVADLLAAAPIRRPADLARHTLIHMQLAALGAVGADLAALARCRPR